MTKEEMKRLDTLCKIINKKMKADERMTLSNNNSRMTSRTFYEGKVSAFNIVLKLIEEMRLQAIKDEWLDLL